ncbi:unnamed protein product, partial [Rotaria sp. Silwood2]
PLRSNSTGINANAKWNRNGLTVAGGNGSDSGINQLKCSWDLYVDNDQTIYVADAANCRIVEWKCDVTSGQMIAGEYGMKRYRNGGTGGTVVAGGNGKGNRLDQLSSPFYVFVDRDHSVYMSDNGNDRVMKWEEGAKQGTVVAGGQGSGNSLTQLSGSLGVVVDQLGIVYITDRENHRIMRWLKGVTQGTVIAGGNRSREQSNQLNCSTGLSFDGLGNLYVVDFNNNRVQTFNID